jgi:peptidoglycan/LPS O-acetylase OafA/YrhL
LKYIKGFDGLRAFSIVLVLLSHLGIKSLLPSNSFFDRRVWLLISGETGVLLFFVLSGYLITRNLIQEYEKHKKVFFYNFIMKRFLRLAPPLVLFYVCILILMHKNAIAHSFTALVLSVFYVFNFAPRYYYVKELVHTWSLAVEEQFYLFWPFILSFLYNNKKRTRVFFVGISLVTFFFLFVSNYWETRDSFYVRRWFFPASFPIFVGAFISISEKFKLFSYSFTSKQLMFVTVLCLLFPIFAPAFLLQFSFLIQSIGFGLLVSFIANKQEASFINTLEFFLFRYIGRISYGIYVYQGLFLTNGPTGELFFQKFPVNILFTFVIAIVSYEFYEKKILKLKSKLVYSN